MNPFYGFNRTLEQDLIGNWQQVMDEVVTLDLFDEMTIDILEDDRERDTTIHQRLEHHWLGSLKIPLLSLLSSPRVCQDYIFIPFLCVFVDLP